MPRRPKRDQRAYLHEILASAQEAQEFIRGYTAETFLADAKTCNAVLMKIQVIGEASRHIAPATAASLPEIPFEKMRGMRNRISHDYIHVNFRIVWRVSSELLDPLVVALQQYLSAADARERATKLAQLPLPLPAKPKHKPH